LGVTLDPVFEIYNPIAPFQLFFVFDAFKIYYNFFNLKGVLKNNV